MKDTEALEKRERLCAIREREIESDRAALEARASTAIAATCIVAFVAFVGGLALGALLP